MILLSGGWNHVKQYTYSQKVFLIVTVEIIFHILRARMLLYARLTIQTMKIGKRGVLLGCASVHMKNIVGFDV